MSEMTEILKIRQENRELKRWFQQEINRLGAEITGLKWQLKELQREKSSESGNPGVEDNWDNYPIEDLGLPLPTYNNIKKTGINTVGELIQMTEENLMKIKGFGRKQLYAVHEKLEEKRLKLASV